MEKISVIGGDTETHEGKPFSFQFVSDFSSGIIFVNEKTATRKFLDYCDSLPEGLEYVIYFHNLAYDLISLFFDRHILFVNDDFSFDVNGWHVEGIYSAICFATLVKDGKRIYLRDTSAFYKTKLSKLADLFCPDIPKLEKPEGLGEKIFTKADKEFCAYALRDAEVTHRIGKILVDWHTKFEIKLTVSAPSFASAVYRKKFLKTAIPLPNKKMIYSALHSYHGGKNALSVKPGWYRGVTLLDINSAYPWAMQQIPDMDNLDRYTYIKSPATKKAPPLLGIYKISGVAKNCRWPVIFDHSFKPIQGEFSNVWVTGPEIAEGLRTGELEISSLYGFFYDVPENATYSLRDYSEHFYKLKNRKDIEKPDRDFYKLLLNSLYGKFIQSKGDKEELGYLYNLDTGRIHREKNIVAGGLFNPIIASLITGFIRARIHFFEHEFKSIHTATDGIFTLEKDFGKKLSTDLGGLKIEAQGDLLIFRNKLYILYSKKEGIDSAIYNTQKIFKFALHGFHGSVFDLERCYKSGHYSYEYVKVNKLKESLRRGLDVNKFENRKAKINLEKVN